MREHGGLVFEVEIGIDAMSIVSALSPENIKAPAEKSMLTHLLWLKEFLRNNVVQKLTWYDTRDITADEPR